MTTGPRGHYKKGVPVEKRVRCQEVMVSKAVPDHIHSCMGDKEHDGEDHFCVVCGRWWGQKGEKRAAGV